MLTDYPIRWDQECEHVHSCCFSEDWDMGTPAVAVDLPYTCWWSSCGGGGCSVGTCGITIPLGSGAPLDHNSSDYRVISMGTRGVAIEPEFEVQACTEWPQFWVQSTQRNKRQRWPPSWSHNHGSSLSRSWRAQEHLSLLGGPQ
jgi:hypothetical protein